MTAPDKRHPTHRAAPDRKRELLEAARRRLLAEGYAKTTVSAVVRDAGVAQGTFYLYFESKEQLVAHLQGGVLRDFLAAFRAGVDGDAPPDERLVRGLVAMTAVVRRHRDLLRVFRQAASGEETEKTLIEGREKLSRPLAQLIADGKATGDFVVDDARLAAHLALAVFDNLIYEALAYERPGTVAAVLQAGARFLLRGLGAPPARVEAAGALAVEAAPPDRSVPNPPR